MTDAIKGSLAAIAALIATAYLFHAPAQRKTLVLPDQPDLWICVNTSVGRTCRTQRDVADWLTESGMKDYEP